jgi:heme/copper-type cytochrome/quinol oxidase subunit 2
MESPTQSTPGGCLIGTLALLPGGVALLGLIGLIKWYLLPVAQRHIDDRFWILVTALMLGTVVSSAMVYLSIKCIRATDFRRYDSRDPDHTNLKW